METLVIQFATLEGLGTEQELNRRHSIEDMVDRALKAKGVGVCDGGQQGAGSAEIFCFVTNRAEAIETISAVCARVLPSKIIALQNKEENRWDVLDPPGGEFTMWGWDATGSTN